MKRIDNITYSDIAQFLSDKKIVAIFQGRGEAGPRALGNRSMLYTPTDPNGRDYVNTVKGREFFRPLAASILFEYANEWFDMLGIPEAAFMTYSFHVQSSKASSIPSVIHVDGSCRIQTVKKEENLHYYNLLSAFYSITKVPMLLNTSLNLAGEPIVETVTDAMRTFAESKINFLYFPELNCVITK